MKAEYTARLRCETCNKEAMHYYHPTAPFKGEWLCCICRAKNQFGDDLSDLVKAAQKRLDREEKERSAP